MSKCSVSLTVVLVAAVCVAHAQERIKMCGRELIRLAVSSCGNSRLRRSLADVELGQYQHTSHCEYCQTSGAFIESRSLLRLLELYWTYRDKVGVLSKKLHISRVPSKSQISLPLLRGPECLLGGALGYRGSLCQSRDWWGEGCFLRGSSLVPCVFSD